MTSKTAFAITTVAVITILLVFRDWRLSQQLDALRQQQRLLQAQQEQAQASLDGTTEQLQRVRAAQGMAPASGQASLADPQGQARLAALEQQIQSLKKALSQRGFGLASIPAVPEYDPTQPPPPEEPAEPETNSTRRSWGPEQVVGPPDTPAAGDYSTAWASREPDGGPEWLSVGFDRAVEVAEVRIRESYNPGAIVRITTMVNNQEIVLWEGQSARGAAPRDFVVRPATSVQAQGVIIHLDTASVPGWNEIDAVELVGRDGSRRWASSATASSSFADRIGATEGFSRPSRLR
jgi:hypothetical protein